MALLKIARMGHEVLHRRAAEIEDPTDPEIARLVRDMIDTMRDAPGAGLAGPQVHAGLRLFVYQIPPHRSEGPDDPPRGPDVLINPVLTPIGDEIVPRLEGCLSIPGMLAEVPRHRRVHWRGVGLDGRVREGEASGFFSNILQHEYDHLDGILYPTRVVNFSMFGFAEEIRARVATQAARPDETAADTGRSA